MKLFLVPFHKYIAMSNPPASSTFWPAYLNYNDYTQPAVWDQIGGSIGESYGPPNENSCAARVSYGLNYGGAPVQPFAAASRNLPDHTYHGKPGDNLRYIVSAMQIAAYLNAEWGAPQHRVINATQLAAVVAGLGTKCAIFATPNPPGGHGHAGVLKSGYQDPFVATQLPVDVWVLGDGR